MKTKGIGNNMAEETKKVYVTKENLQKVLEHLKKRNNELYLDKTAQAQSAGKVANALTLTVGDEQVVFDGSAEKTAEVAAKLHAHTAADVSDFESEVKKILAAADTTHTHDNKAELDKIVDGKVAAWDAKIGVDDVAGLKYTNAGVGGETNVKTALDILVKNVQIGNAVLADATANVNGLADRLTTAEGDIDVLETAVGDKDSGLVKQVADNKAAIEKEVTDRTAAVTTEKERAEAAETGLQNAIDAINNNATGILAQAKAYADQKDTVLDGKITKAQTTADKGVQDAAAEKTRAEGVEQGLRADLGQVNDSAKADGSAFARIAQVKADLAAEITRADNAEKVIDTKVNTAQNAIDILNGGIDQEGSVDKKIADKISEVNTAAGNLEKRVKANEDAIDIINGTGEGSIKKAVSDLVNGAPEAMNTLKELADAITAHEGVYQGYVAQVTKDIAAAKDAAITAAAKDAADKDTALHTTITGEIATAKSEAIADAAAKDTTLENKLQGKIDEKVDQTVYEAKVADLVQADADNLAAAKQFAQNEDKKITDKIGIADDTLVATTVFGKIKELQAKDDAQDTEINKKAAAADLDALETLVGTATDTKDDATAFGKIAAEADRAIAAEEALAGRVGTAEGKIATLEGTVGDAQSGLVKDVNDLKAIGANTRLATAESEIDAIQQQLANLVPLTDAELQAMLDDVY